MTVPNVPNYDKRFEATLLAGGDEERLNVVEIDENTIQIMESCSALMSSYMFFSATYFASTGWQGADMKS